MIDVPRLVGDHQVVIALLDDFLEHHEVAQQDLVHAPQRLETVEVVLARLAGDVARLAGQVLAGRMNLLALGFEDRGDGVLGKPIDL